VECVDDDNVDRCNTKTASLLSEDRKKCLPGEDQLARALEAQHEAWLRLTGGSINARFSPSNKQSNKEQSSRLGKPLCTNKMAPHYPRHIAVHEEGETSGAIQISK
jgi:hypothetical protein